MSRKRYALQLSEEDEGDVVLKVQGRRRAGFGLNFRTLAADAPRQAARWGTAHGRLHRLWLPASFRLRMLERRPSPWRDDATALAAAKQGLLLNGPDDRRRVRETPP